MNLLTKIKKFTDLENDLMVAGGRMGEAIVRWFGMDMYTPMYLKWITNKDLLYSTWNSVQWYVAARTRGVSGGGWVYVCVWPIPLPFAWNYHNVVNWLYGNTHEKFKRNRHTGDWHALPLLAPPEFSWLVSQVALSFSWGPPTASQLRQAVLIRPGWWSRSAVPEHTFFLIHSSDNGLLGYFHSGADINNAALNIRTWVFVWTCILCLLGTCPDVVSSLYIQPFEELPECFAKLLHHFRSRQ